MSISDSLTKLHADTFAEFEKLHDANNEARQQDANLREAVGQVSAAVTALGKAAKAAGAAEI